MIRLRAAALSEIGKVRLENEDRYLLDPDTMLFGVADGVGGLPAGAEAAQLTVETVGKALGKSAGGRPESLVKAAVDAHCAVQKLGQVLSPAIGIASTLTFGQVHDNAMEVAHVGDSRCYLWRDQRIEQITRDHSVENENRDQRTDHEATAWQHHMRKALTRCVGQPGIPAVDVFVRPLRAGDRFLFCSDGISGQLEPRELERLLGQHNDPAVVLREIIDLILSRGAPDNATGVLIFVDETA